MNDYLRVRELYHWGIKGQKWGVRRYQNEDGTLTEEGKKRYQKLEDEVMKAALLEERGVAIANYGNLSEGRAHNDDSPEARAIRRKYTADRKKIDSMIKELDESGYFKQVFGKSGVSFNDYKSSIERQAVAEFTKKYGEMKISKHDPTGSIDYESAIYDFTNRELKYFK